MRIVGGMWGGRRITAPPGRDTRPTSDRLREAWMSAIGPWIPGARVVDLFAGSGALGLEALSRGAEHATFVERSPAALRILEANIRTLAVEPDRIAIVRTDAIEFVAALAPLEYDLAFADPPYGRGFAARLAELYRAVPFARILCVEHAVNEPIPVLHPLRQRRYGDTLLTFIGGEHEA